MIDCILVARARISRRGGGDAALGRVVVEAGAAAHVVRRCRRVDERRNLCGWMEEGWINVAAEIDR